MPQKKHKAEVIVAKLRQVDVLVSPGQSVAESARSIGVTKFTYCRWRKECPPLISALRCRATSRGLFKWKQRFSPTRSRRVAPDT